MSVHKPNIGKRPNRVKSPIVEDDKPKPKPRKFVFSFKYFSQNERYFGLGGQSHSWFVSWLEKMREISGKEYEVLVTSLDAKKAWRLHEIEWNLKNVPVLRQNLKWIDKKYLDNDAEYPFFQFQVSTALGRVIGFWDEEGAFNVVFLDTMHNMQPSKFSDYKLRETVIGRSEFSYAIIRLEEAISKCSDGCNCRKIFGEIQTALSHNLPFETTLVPMEKGLFERTCKFFETGAIKFISELIELSLKNFEC